MEENTKKPIRIRPRMRVAKNVPLEGENQAKTEEKVENEVNCDPEPPQSDVETVSGGFLACSDDESMPTRFQMHSDGTTYIGNPPDGRFSLRMQIPPAEGSEGALLFNTDTAALEQRLAAMFSDQETEWENRIASRAYGQRMSPADSMRSTRPAYPLSAIWSSFGTNRTDWPAVFPLCVPSATANFATAVPVAARNSRGEEEARVEWLLSLTFNMYMPFGLLNYVRGRAITYRPDAIYNGTGPRGQEVLPATMLGTPNPTRPHEAQMLHLVTFSITMDLADLDLIPTPDIWALLEGTPTGLTSPASPPTNMRALTFWRHFSTAFRPSFRVLLRYVANYWGNSTPSTFDADIPTEGVARSAEMESLFELLVLVVDNYDEALELFFGRESLDMRDRANCPPIRFERFRGHF